MNHTTVTIRNDSATQHLLSQNKTSTGFTIVELLIVIVVIGILAAITIVAYNGIQNRAKTQSGDASASVIQKKIEAYNATFGSYPVDATNALYTATLNSQIESTIVSTGVTLGTPSAVNGTKTVKVSRCTAPALATGYKIENWEFSTGALDTSFITGNLNNTVCTTWTALT